MSLRHSKVFLFINLFLFLLIPLTSFSLDLGASMPLSSSGIQTQKVFPEGSARSVKKFSVSFPAPFTGQAGQYTALNIEGCSATDRYGYHMPVKVITLDFPAGTYLSSVKITGGQWQEIYGEFNLLPSSSLPSPLPGEGEGEGASFLPGTFVEAGAATLAGSTIVSVSIFPVQYNPETRKALFLQQADVEVSYGQEAQAVPQILIPLASAGEYYAQIDSSAECIIITPQKYYNQALQLKNIHESQSLGASINTTIVTTEEIAGRPYGETSQPPLAPLPNALCPEGGFASRTGAAYPYREMLARSYNDILARKILSFLLDCRDAPGYKQDTTPSGYYSFMQYLQHIVILGNAAEIPPSYYAYSTVTGTGDSYENYIPTDYFYSACGNNGLINLNPYAGIGRFPVARSEAVTLHTGLTITVLNTGARTITVNMGSDPGSLSDMTVIITSGLATNRWLDIQGSSWSAGVLTLTLRQNRNSGEAWMTTPAIAVGNTLNIIDASSQMQAMMDKVEDWVDARAGVNDWFKRVSFAGGTYKSVVSKSTTGAASLGSASLSSLYWDELSCVEAVNKVDEAVEGGDGLSYVAGLGVRKYFATNIKPDWTTYDDAFIVADITGILSNNASHQAGILYFAGDGQVDAIYLENGNIGSSSLLGYGTSTNNSFIVSHAGSTAAFDEEIWSSSPPVSFGKASLLSPAAAVAYFGPTRSSLHTLSWSRAADGRLVHSQIESNELTMNVLRRYHRAKAGNPTINAVVTKALGDYYTKNLASGSPIRHFRTLIEYNLLGSPAIYIPAPGLYSSGDEHTGIPVATPLNPDRVNSDNVPLYEVADSSTKTVSVSYSSLGADNEIKLVDPRYYTGDDKTTGSTSGTYTFPAFDAVDTGRTDTTNGPGLYFVRVSQKEKSKTYYTKESRYYFEVVNTFTASGDILIIDDDQPRRYTSNSNSPDGTELAWQSMYPDYEDYYKAALDALGKTYKVWHVENKNGSNAAGQGRYGEVTFAQALQHYTGEGKAVIWFTGNDWFTTILSNERTALQQFLDAGGKLFITGQDIGYDVRNTSFYQNYLRAGYVQDNISLLRVDGITDDDLSDGLENIIISSGDGAYNQNWPSEIDPQSGALPCLFYHPSGSGGGARMSSGSAGIRYYNAQTEAAVVYFSFGFEAINHDDIGQPASSRRSVMEKVLHWLLGDKEPTTGNLNATGLDASVLLEWSNPFYTSSPGILIVYRATDGYPTGVPDPVSGTVYSPGQTIAGGTVVYSATSASPSGSYTHGSLVNGTTYYYRAYYYQTGGLNYTYLDIASATPQEGVVPGELVAPTNLMATAIEESGLWRIELSWQDNSADPDEDGFEIQRKVGLAGSYTTLDTVGTGIQSYTDNAGGAGLTPDTIYFYQVRAFKGATQPWDEQSAWSNEASAATSYMAAPSNLRAIGGEREVWLSWQDNSPGALGFEVQRKHPTSSTPTPAWAFVAYAPAGSVSYRDELKTSPNIPDGRPYYYRIRAYNAVTETDWSNETWTNPIPSAFPAGEDPTNLQVFPGWNTLVVQFDDNTSNESSYRVEIWTTPPSNTGTYSRFVTVPPLSGNTTTDSPVIIEFTTGGRYYVRVIAFHKTSGYGYSRYATVAGSPGSTYISFDLPEQVSTSETGNCFIATAAFGSPCEKNVHLLREFRDRHLMNRKFGRAFVRWYYRHSPPLADYIRRRPAARALVRAALRPIAWLISLAI